MKSAVKAFGSTFRLFSLLSVLVVGCMSAGAQARHYVCPPCGAPCDTVVYDKAGPCPLCGMALVDQKELQARLDAAGPSKMVVILIFDGVQIIDYTGPFEMFGAAGYEVYTVAEKKSPVTTSMGMTVVPKYSFADVPKPDVLVVPGGGVAATQRNEMVLKWIRDETAQTRHTMSVCNGAFILASAGLLDGLAATTTSGNIDRLRKAYPKIHVIDDQRFVDNGKIITTAGLTAGIDGALHVISLMEGPGYAEQVALGEEYDWRPHSGFVRAALADKVYLPFVDSVFDAAGKWTVVSTQGGTDHWEMVVRGSSNLGGTELMERLGRDFVTRAKWSPAKDGERTSGGWSNWTFSGRNGKPWRGTLRVQASVPHGHQYTITLNISRAG